MNNMKIVFTDLTKRVSQTWGSAIETYKSKPKSVQQEMFKKAMDSLYEDYALIARKVCEKKQLDKNKFNVNKIDFKEYKFIENYYSETVNFAGIIVEAAKIGETVYEGYMPGSVDIDAFGKEWKELYDAVMKNFTEYPAGLAAFTNVKDYYDFIVPQFKTLLHDNPEQLQKAYDILQGKCD